MPRLLGYDDDYLMNQLGMGSGELEQMISAFLRNISTTGQQQANTAAEMTVDAPIGTQLAAQRGVNYGINETAGKGIEGLEQYGKDVNRQAFQTILQGKLQQKGIKAQQDMADSQFWASLLQGLGMAGTAALLGPAAPAAPAAAAASDRRLKRNIRKIGNVKGYNIYTWDWIDGFDGGYNEGVIAQEVQKINPNAVVVMDNGFLGVNYSLL